MIRQLKTGIDALDLINTIPDEIWAMIDTVIWDPPYFDDDNKDHIERVNERSRLKSQSTRVLFKKQFTRIMNRDHRENILNTIRSKLTNYHIIHFHTVREELKIDNVACEHVWVKPIMLSIAGNNDRNNGEFIVIEGRRIPGRIPGRILNKYINADFNNRMSPRANTKPLFLFTELYRHLDSKFVLDPFAGYGNSIKACDKMGLSVYAGDIDSSLTWDKEKDLRSFF